MVKVLHIPNAAVGDSRRRPMLVRMVGAFGTAVFVLLLSAPGRAQITGTQAGAARSSASQAAEPPKQAEPAPTATTAAQPPAAAATEEEPALSAAGHRDPFRPMIVIKASVNQLPPHLPPGKPGLVIGQLALLGIVHGLKGVWIAVVDNQSKRAYFLYQGDQLYNGAVSRITPDGVVFQERFTDPAGQQKTREIVKQLNPR